MTEEEHDLLKLGPKFIFDNPKTAARRRNIELAAVKRKIQRRFYDRKVAPGRPVDQFVAELDLILQKMHNISVPPRRTHQEYVLEFPIQSIMSSQNSQQKRQNKKNYNRALKRLRHKLRSKNIILQKTDKSKVFHLGRIEDYWRKSDEYMQKTQAYQYLGRNDPLPDLIQRTNRYLLELRLAKWVSQKQYEQLCVNPTEVELAHLYYLPKAHKPGTPLRPIVSGLKHPTIKISKFLDDLLRPLFNDMSQNTSVKCGFELLKKVINWSSTNLTKETLFCTIDVTDLYTMIPQVEGVLSLKRMLDYLQLKQIGGLKTEAVIRLSRFVVQNNYFSFNGQFYQQIRGGAMGSPLTLTIANCYMFFFEQQIRKQIFNSGGLYLRYIDDIFIIINWPERHLRKEIERWNLIDHNIKLKASIGKTTNFLDLYIENKDGILVTKVYHKPSYEPYYLPFHSIHPLHMKKNIPFAMMLRAIRYCSTFQLFVQERESLRMSLLLNKYPNRLIEEQFENVFKKLNSYQPHNAQHYDKVRQVVILQTSTEKEAIDYENNIFIHFTFCSSMKDFPRQFQNLWQKYFNNSPISDIRPILGTRNVGNLQQQLVRNQ